MYKLAPHTCRKHTCRSDPHMEVREVLAVSTSKLFWHNQALQTSSTGTPICCTFAFLQVTRASACTSKCWNFQALPHRSACQSKGLHIQGFAHMQVAIAYASARTFQRFSSDGTSMCSHVQVLAHSTADMLRHSHTQVLAHQSACLHECMKNQVLVHLECSRP